MSAKFSDTQLLCVCFFVVFFFQKLHWTEEIVAFGIRDHHLDNRDISRAPLMRRRKGKGFNESVRKTSLNPK